MAEKLEKIGFGGGCHWCTEAIYLSLKGVKTVEQGWIASQGSNADFSEAVIVSYDPQVISLQTLIEIHLNTHSSTATHSNRLKYRSAVYTYNDVQLIEASETINTLQHMFDKSIITQVIHLINFRLNSQHYLDYYYSDNNKPFCKNMIAPKLKLLVQRFAKNINTEKLAPETVS